MDNIPSRRNFITDAGITAGALFTGAHASVAQAQTGKKTPCNWEVGQATL